MVRIKSNAMSGLAIINAKLSWHRLIHRQVHLFPHQCRGTVLASGGGQDFTVYVQDLNEPGTGNDKFWFTHQTLNHWHAERGILAGR